MRLSRSLPGKADLVGMVTGKAKLGEHHDIKPRPALRLAGVHSDGEVHPKVFLANRKACS